MPFVFKTLAVTLSIAALSAADKPKFEVRPASSYPSKQTNDKVTIAAEPFETDEQAKPAFGKLNPYKYGVLPILVVIQNDSSQTLRLDSMRVEYIGPDRSHIESTPAKDVPYLSGPERPGVVTGPVPTGSPRVHRKKNPLNAPEIEIRAFTAKMLPPGESASGFFYFQTGHRNGSKLYVTGIQEAASGKELLYFEIPLAGVR